MKNRVEGKPDESPLNNMLRCQVILLDYGNAKLADSSNITSVYIPVYVNTYVNPKVNPKREPY
jgi:hypothetical protein